MRSSRYLWRAVTVALFLLVILAAGRASDVRAARSQQVTPAVACDSASTPATTNGGDMMAGTPMSGMDHHAMAAATPQAAVEFDQLYIDMMIPHHASIIALAQAAVSRVADERLREIAERVIATQGAEIDELRGYREQFYGSAEPMSMDAPMMSMMMDMMPGMTGSMDAMAAQMDAATQVTAFCAAFDPDLALIDLMIPHHQSAIAASEAALDQATHDEIRMFAERVIEDQQREIDELSAIRLELYGSATPEPVETS